MFAIPAQAERYGGIDSGGGKSVVGTLINHGAIGEAVASSVVAIGTSTVSSGLIEVLYVGPAPYDADNDGLPDEWEKEHFGNIEADPQGDPDGDCNTNLMEFLAGTDPNDITSRFNPRGNHDGADYAFPVQTIVNRSYKVYVSKNLEDWYIQQTINGDGTQHIFSFDPSTLAAESPLYGSPKFFFRVEISIPAAP
ncbi:MAG: hypothetical protein KJO21_05240 [Verrucomicrobiae bacterium]|nr:hypothetical protein [Verrucomicrobiae bacterium]NNJ43128.1 hypothetical protein [Akkermansiaceae bacterium]